MSTQYEIPTEEKLKGLRTTIKIGEKIVINGELIIQYVERRTGNGYPISLVFCGDKEKFKIERENRLTGASERATDKPKE